jgi:hypothetical protein
MDKVRFIYVDASNAALEMLIANKYGQTRQMSLG